MEGINNMRQPWERHTVLSALKDGWDFGDGLAVSKEAFSTVRAIFSPWSERPSVFPTREGGLMVEWEHDNTWHALEVLHDGTIDPELTRVKE